MGFFVYFGEYNTKIELFKLTITLITSMAIWKMGIDKIFKFITKKLGIELSQKENNGDNK